MNPVRWRGRDLGVLDTVYQALNRFRGDRIERLRDRCQRGYGVERLTTSS